MTGKTTFLVGRRTRGATMVMLLRSTAAPIRGPWTLRAVISSN